MSDNTFTIYQVKEGMDTRAVRFVPLEQLRAAGLSVAWDNYNHLYTGALKSDADSELATLEALFETFNTARPADFSGRSLSVSDIVVLYRDEKAAAYYVDSIGFSETPEFQTAPYHYYSTQRPIDLGTFPKTENGPVHFVNFDKREWRENSTFRAWGYLAYDAPLTVKQMGDYELRAASDNPDNIRVSPYQLEAQVQVIGKWEKAHRLSDMSRITWYNGDFGVFVRKEWVMFEQVADRFNDIMEATARAAEKRRAAPGNADTKRSPEEKVQIVGIWEDENNVPEKKRYTWHKPSIQAFALREPAVSQERLEERFSRALRDLTRADEKRSAPRPIAEQLADAQKQMERGAETPAPAKTNINNEDR